jgi:hypothetical protein
MVTFCSHLIRFFKETTTYVDSDKRLETMMIVERVDLVGTMRSLVALVESPGSRLETRESRRLEAESRPSMGNHCFDLVAERLERRAHQNRIVDWESRLVDRLGNRRRPVDHLVDLASFALTLTNPL